MIDKLITRYVCVYIIIREIDFWYAKRSLSYSLSLSRPHFTVHKRLRAGRSLRRGHFFFFFVVWYLLFFFFLPPAGAPALV